MVDEATGRRLTARAGCVRILSGPRPVTVRDQLHSLADPASGIDLDTWPDRYGDGPVAELERRVALLLDKPSAVYFPSGTMAQQVALRYGAERLGNPAVALHPLSHLELYERHAYTILAGLRPVFTPGGPHQIVAADVAELDEPVATVVVELPLRDAGFLLPDWDSLLAIVAAARSRGARVHFDGARLWESTTHLGQSLSDVAALADSVYVSFYKSLGALSGAALAGDTNLAGYARAWRHRYGGNLYEHWPAALTAMTGLATRLPALPGLVAHAKVVAAALADALAGTAAAQVWPHPPHTHQFQVWLPYPPARLTEVTMALAAEERTWFIDGWRPTAVPHLSMAEVTVAEPALAWTAADVTDVATRYLTRLAT